MEMLIVVAIIAILIAISIPFLNDALERARQATDAANERAAKAEIIVAYYLDADIIANTKVEAGKEYPYDAATGKLLTSDTTSVSSKYGKCKDHKGGYIKVSISTADEVTVKWYDGDGNVISKDLCSKNVTSK